MTTKASKGPPIYSELAEDPDFGELVEMFVDEIPNRVQTLLTAHQAGDRESLRRTAHQLKGAAGSYGFGQVTHAAFGLEHALREKSTEQVVCDRLAELIDLCERMRAGVPA